MQTISPVVILAHDEQESISSTISSVISQSGQPRERLRIFVVTNGCTDSTNDIAAGFSAFDPRVQLIALPRKGKIYAIREAIDFLKCLEDSHNFDRVFFLDADVQLPSDAMAKLSADLDQSPDLYLVSAASHGLWISNWFLRKLDKTRQVVHRGLNANLVRGRCYVIRYNALLQVDFPPFILSDDMFLEVRLFGHYKVNYDVSVATHIKSTVINEIKRDLFLQIARDQLWEWFATGRIPPVDPETARPEWQLRYPTTAQILKHLLSHGMFLSLSVLAFWSVVVRLNRRAAHRAYDRKHAEELLGYWETSR